MVLYNFDHFGEKMLPVVHLRLAIDEPVHRESQTVVEIEIFQRAEKDCARFVLTCKHSEL